MPRTSGAPCVQLATKVPKALHRDVRLYCVNRSLTVMEFVIEALTDKLDREVGRRRSAARRSG